MRAPFRRKNFHWRVLLPCAAALLVVALARPTPTTLAVGLLLVAAGETLRLWAAGHLVKTQDLTLSGPYRFLRHPLYAGTLLIGAGFIIAAGPPVTWVAMPLGLAFFFFRYLPAKDRRESGRLETRYGSRYDAYRKQVRGILPRLQPWGGPVRSPGEARAARVRWSFDRVVGNDELGTLFAVVMLLAAFAAVLVVRTPGAGG
jgi:protein-S-isoprenylcysteine O-methyltransferase Ste14